LKKLAQKEGFSVDFERSFLVFGKKEGKGKEIGRKKEKGTLVF
jgi:hypothetical protein